MIHDWAKMWDECALCGEPCAHTDKGHVHEDPELDKDHIARPTRKECC